MGPMAQDFSAAFGLGEDDKHISTVDADGVALAAIQGLHQQLQTKIRQLAKQERELARFKARLAEQNAQLDVMSSTLRALTQEVKEVHATLKSH